MEEEETAMLAKKPLGWSCASCQKDLTNISFGQQNQFQNWNKLPFRNPGERIARVGQGFSKMLSQIKPEDAIQEHPSTRSQKRESAGRLMEEVLISQPNMTNYGGMYATVKNKSRRGYQTQQHSAEEDELKTDANL